MILGRLMYYFIQSFIDHLIICFFLIRSGHWHPIIEFDLVLKFWRLIGHKFSANWHLGTVSDLFVFLALIKNGIQVGIGNSYLKFFFEFTYLRNRFLRGKPAFMLFLINKIRDVEFFVLEINFFKTSFGKEKSLSLSIYFY